MAPTPLLSTGWRASLPTSAISAASPPTRSSSTPARSCAPRWPIPRASWMPTPQASAWWPGSRPTTAWCWNNERAPDIRKARALCRDHALSLDGAVLPGAVRLRAEDRAVADRDRAAALHAGVRCNGRPRSHQGGARAIVTGQFQAADLGQSLHPVVSAQPAGRAVLHRHAAPDRLPRGLWHGAAAATLAGDRDDAGDCAVLDLVPDPHLCLD